MEETSLGWLDQLYLLDSGKHTDPHSFLGLHVFDEYQKIIRFYAPRRQEYSFEYLGKIVQATPSEREGLFTYLVPLDTTRYDYRIFHSDGSAGHDPYNFAPIITPFDSFLFGKGEHYQIYELLGSHVRSHEGVSGVQFAVWAPNAQSVSLVGDFNRWKEAVHPMRKVSNDGLWELFVPGLAENQIYKYAIKTPYSNTILKQDPFAHAFELRPKTASIVSRSSQFHWTDQEWMKKRVTSPQVDGPMNIYEIHFGSWQKKKNGEFPNYREMASEIVRYLKEMGYTHVEIMPITEYPLDESWGYQVTGYFAPTSRYGSMEDFQYFVDHLHLHGIGVILDWAPAHFPSDDFALAKFDGSCVYEHEAMGIHPQWGSLFFNYDDKRVSNFLIGSALFWIDKMHVDGIRIDAVQSMLFLDYGREGRAPVTNQYGGNENLGAIDFCKRLNQVVHERFPGVVTIAEDASLRQGITQPVEWGGLGFDLKWSIGWMHDTLRFMKRDPVHRKHHMGELLGTFNWCFEERYILPISHDEVVHEKRTLLGKMPLADKEKFDQVRLYYSAALSHPGKNLFFMGTELGQWEEWSPKKQLDWHLLQYPSHSQLAAFIKDANHFYLAHPALWQIDFDKKGFEWIDCKDYDHSVISYLRRGIEERIVCVHNYTKSEFDEYNIYLPGVLRVEEVFNSDEIKYGGSGRVNCSIKALPYESGFQIQMPPLATMFFSVDLREDVYKK